MFNFSICPLLNFQNYCAFYSCSTYPIINGHFSISYRFLQCTFHWSLGWCEQIQRQQGLDILDRKPRICNCTVTYYGHLSSAVERSPLCSSELQETQSKIWRCSKQMKERCQKPENFDLSKSKWKKKIKKLEVWKCRCSC